MGRNRRLFAFLITVVALGLTVTGIVIAASDPNPAGVDPLKLNGYPPTSAALSIVLSTGSGQSLNVTANVNFETSRVSALVVPSVAGVSGDVALRVVGSTLYVRNGDTNGPWYATPLASRLNLFGLALELTQPDIALISGFSSDTVTQSGYSTIYTFSRDHVALRALGAKHVSTSNAALTWTITTGSQGEVTGSTLAITGGDSPLTIDANVTAYNGSARIEAPRSTRPLAKKDVRALLNEIGQFNIQLPVGLVTSLAGTAS